VVTSLLVVNEFGQIEEQAGGYSDWEARGGRLESETATVSKAGAQHSQQASAKQTPTDSSPTLAKSPAKKAAHKKLSYKLSYKEQRELDELPAKIEQLEAQLAQLEAKINEPTFYNNEQTIIDDTLKTLSDVERALNEALERWTELEP